MRLSYFLLAAAVTLVSTSGTVSAATSISGVAATDSVQSDKRFLRSIESNQEGGDLDSADEERALNRVIPNLKINIPEVNLNQFKIPQVKKVQAAAYTHPLLRPLDEVLASVKSPLQLNKMGVNLQTKMDENVIAKSFVNQFIDEQWPLQVLRQNLGITRNTAKTSEKYQAYVLLIQARSYNNVQAKTGWATKPLVWRRSVKDTVNSLSKNDAVMYGKNLQENLQKNPLAKNFAEQYKGQKWDMKLLVEKLGITTQTPKYADEYAALWLLRDVQAWNKFGSFKI